MRELQEQHPELISATWFIDDSERGLLAAEVGPGLLDETGVTFASVLLGSIHNGGVTVGAREGPSEDKSRSIPRPPDSPQTLNRVGITVVGVCWRERPL
jgi:hypothetical protein